MHSLSSSDELDHGTMWKAMRLLLDRLNGTIDSATAMDDCLDIVVELLGADRGLIVLTLESGVFHTITARDASKSLSAEEREKISRTIVREARDSSSFVQYLPLEMTDPPESMSRSGIVAALAAPLPERVPGNVARRVLYVDFRDPSQRISERHVEFFLAATTLVGATLDQASIAAEEAAGSAEFGGALLRRTPAATAPERTPDTWQLLQDERGRLERREEQLIRDALIRSAGVVAHAARELGIARTTLSSRVDTLGLRTLREQQSASRALKHAGFDATLAQVCDSGANAAPSAPCPASRESS